MKIQWYPGHMNKARREVAERLAAVNLVIEVADARIPFSSRNPMLHELAAAKARLCILAKDDLADPERTEIWLAHFRAQSRDAGDEILAANLKASSLAQRVIQACRKVGGKKDLRVLVVGIPNAGKSTLINALAGKAIARTGNEPAVTRHQQQVRISEQITLFDSPGILWPNVENRDSGYRLAATGGIRATAYDEVEVALYTAEFLARDYPQLLQERFALDELASDGLNILEAIGRRRGCLRGGGEVDLNRAARILLTEFRAGSIGRITMETPEGVAGELKVTEREREEKAARKAARKRAWGHPLASRCQVGER